VTITLSGLASGLDTQTIMNSLMKVEQIPLTQLQSQQASYQQASSTMSTFLSKVSALRSAAQTLADPSTYRSLTASSSDTGVSATVSGAASPGSYSVKVLALAHEQRTRSDAVDSGTDALGQSGTVSLQVGSGTAVNVDVSASDSLADIADNINKSGARVSASVLYDGSKYRLLLRGTDSGAANAITISEAGTSLNLADPDNTYQAATDSHVQIDGNDITRSTNVVQGALPGLTLSLTKETSSAATVTVSSDPSALTTKINALVSAYNDVVNTGHADAGYGTSKAQNSVLQSDTAIRTTLDRLSQILGSVVAGTSGRYTTLSSVGLSSTKDGTLQLDSTKLQSALAKDPSSVARLFNTDTSTGATGAMGLLTSAIDTLTKGNSSVLAGRKAALDAHATKLGDDADALSRRINLYQQQLQDQFTALETTMGAIKAQNSAFAGLTGYSSVFSSSTTTSSSG
jgi:flagellar hook-associated protein 2